jgi:hypothetical protein
MTQIIKSNLKSSDRVRLKYNNKEVEMSIKDFTLELLSDENSALLVSGGDAQVLSDKIQGHYSLLSPYYFGGVATEKDIALEDVDQWCDVELTLAPNGTFDYRPDAMIAAQATGHTGTGASGDPFIFKLEGLTQSSFASLRASMSFLPDEDEGQLETRLLFTTHIGSAFNEFAIEEVSLNMQNGADVDYTTEPTLSFFVGDTIDTNGTGDAGTFKFQVRVSVPGVISMRGLSFYINK